MTARIVANAILIVLTVIAQVSFLPTWPWPISTINLILSIIIFISIIINYNQGLWWAFAGGLLLGLFSSLPFGAVAIGLTLTVALTNKLFTNFFTNKSRYTLVILSYAATVCYETFDFIVRLITVLFGWSDATMLGAISIWSALLWQPLLNIFIVNAVFFAYNRSTSKLKHIVFHPDQRYEVINRH